MTNFISRRKFLGVSTCGLAYAALGRTTAFGQPGADFKISLSEYSLRRELDDGSLRHLEFAAIAKTQFEINAIEYASSYFSKEINDELLAEMNKRAAEHGVRQVLIRVDDQGDLANSDADERRTAIEDHRRWIDHARTLGCHAIGVSISGDDEPAEICRRAAESLTQLAEYATTRRIHVLVSNGEAPSSDPQWLVTLLELIDSPQIGALPGFVHFGESDPLEGMRLLAPLARGVRAVSHEFDENGNEVHVDFASLMQVVLNSGYQGHVSIEHLGDTVDSAAGIRATQALLERVRLRFMRSGNRENENP